MTTNILKTAGTFAVAKNDLPGRGLIKGLSAHFQAIRRGVEVARTYDRLVERGMAPDAAAREAMTQLRRG